MSVLKNTEEDATDDILAELEAETANTSSDLNQKRVEEIQTDARNAATKGQSQIPASMMRHTPYTVLTCDSDTLQFTTEHEKAVVHFRHSDFARCAIMDAHLNMIARRHELGEAGGDEVEFGTIDVEKAPFVVEKLSIRVLPCVIGFAKGIVKGKVLGFEGICWGKNENSVEVSKALEDKLVSWGMLKSKLLTEEYGSDESDDADSRRDGNRRRGFKSAGRRAVDEDDDWD